MEQQESLVEKLDGLRVKAQVFVAAIGLMGALLVASSLVAWQSSREQESLALAHAQTLRILRASNDVRVASLNTLRGERGYLLTQRVEDLEPYFSGRRDLVASLDELDRYTVEGGESQETVTQLRSAISAYLLEIGRIVSLARGGDMAEARAIVDRSASSEGISSIDRMVETIISSERKRFRSLNDHVGHITVTLLRFIYLMSFAGLCLLVLAVMSAIALRRSFVRERVYRAELRKRAETDELTGVANRRQLLAYLDRRIAEARRTQTPLSFAMFDIDRFKRVNDSFGHAVGDEAIRHVVRTAQKAVRVNDMLGRLGGEEFGMVLPKSSEDNAYMVCERLRQRLHAKPFVPMEGERMTITISSGIAFLNDEDDAASLIERADKALYEAKRSGRDQVRLAA